MAQTDETRDTELLETFVNQRDEVAFAELVRRHRGTVMSACRRILGNTPDAEDAFQAVFLALAKEASKLTRHPAIGAWLHRVACGTAIDACRRRKTREEKEKEASTMQEEISEPSQVTDETGALLHAELSALPERYRRSLILFHIEGQSLEEAGRQLEVPVNTVSTWLRRGREKLRGRLLRKGVAFSIAGIGVVLSAESAAAGVADALAISTAKAAVTMAGGSLVTGGAGAVSTNVAGMLKEALKMVFMAKVKVACLVGSGVILAGATTAVVAEKAVETRRETEETRAKAANVTWEKWDEKPSDRYPVQMGPKLGYIDRSGKLVIAPEYTLGTAFQCDRAIVSTNGPDTMVIDSTGRIVFSSTGLTKGLPFTATHVNIFDYNEGLAAVTLTGTSSSSGRNVPWYCGYIDTAGNWVIPPLYTESSPRFRDGRVAVTDTTGLSHILNRSGNKVFSLPSGVKPDYVGMQTGGDFGEGLLPVRSKSEPTSAGFVAETGYQIPCRFLDGGRFSEGLAAVRSTRGFRYIDKTGEYAFSGEFEEAYPFSEGLACIQRQGKFGCIDRTAKTVVPFDYDGVGRRCHFSGMVESPGFAGGILSVSKGKRWGLINRDNKVVVPIEFDWAEGDASGDGLCRVSRQFFSIRDTKDAGEAMRQYNLALIRKEPVRVSRTRGDPIPQVSLPVNFDSYYDATGKLVFDGFAKARNLGLVVEKSVEP